MNHTLNPVRASKSTLLSERRGSLLYVRDLSTHFVGRRGIVRAVDGVSFEVRHGETVCLIGESGSGKSVTGLSLLGILPTQGRSTSGTVIFNDRDLLALNESALRRIRGSEIAMVFQDAMTALNPVHTIGEQIVEVIRTHRSTRRREAWREAVAMLELVGMPDAERRMDSYPHELSGGMSQRAVIAVALACRPKLLIADEPTTALDVTIQAQILALIQQLQQQIGMAVLFITHDLGVVAQIADRVVVMYAGRIVEEGDVEAVLSQPLMPYTRALLGSIPRVDQPRDRSRRLGVIGGSVPDPASHSPSGCAFIPRCPDVQPSCNVMPALEDTGLGADRRVRCGRWRELLKPLGSEMP